MIKADVIDFRDPNGVADKCIDFFIKGVEIYVYGSDVLDWSTLHLKTH